MKLSRVAEGDVLYNDLATICNHEPSSSALLPPIQLTTFSFTSWLVPHYPSKASISLLYNSQFIPSSTFSSPSSLSSLSFFFSTLLRISLTQLNPPLSIVTTIFKFRSSTIYLFLPTKYFCVCKTNSNFSFTFSACSCTY